ncbi:VOC family protein [Telmatocola sphagniphila]|uniref:VOC family protein n=1 Tax=Telmatocola sphagniphila TaxID=1123043 RepID=A0A8E6B4Y5_9BACT|nr:VOC family protein [Telmatocola sphagniphila]QVL31846.1 VOC family protein [Telmatocola sphagniphila]
MILATELVPHLVVKGGKAAVEFYGKAFGATAASVVPVPGSEKLMHADLRIGNLKFYLCDDFPEQCGGVSRAPNGPTSFNMHLDVPNVDEAIAQAAEAGATVTMPATDMFWGDRYGQIVDPFGHTWSFRHPLKQA